MFALGHEDLYRRFTINELARIQTFPNNYFKFTNINSAYKMIGNAVPCKLAEFVALSIKHAFSPKKILSFRRKTDLRTI